MRFAVATLCLWCLILLGFRVGFWQSKSFLFLPYNLFLAAIPLFLSEWAARRSLMREKIFLGACWLLFFPNAPYLLTDLVHLSLRRGVPLFFFDGLMLFSYGAAGSILGFLSLRQMQNAFFENGCAKLSWVFAITSLFLCSFGIYLGRVVRLNSWDVICRPFHLLNSIVSPILNPAAHLSTWAMTFGMGVTLSFGYWLFTAAGSGKTTRTETVKA